MNLWIGLSALQASQFGINSVSHNLANASTEGYHRQDVGLETRQSQLINGQFIGSGVQVGYVRRMRDQIVESAFTNSITDLSAIDQRLLIESRIESFLLPGEGSVQNSLTGMFDEFARLSSNPNERTLRTSVVSQGVNLAGRLRELSGEFVELKDSIGRQLDLEVQGLNQDIERLVDLQNRINSVRIHDVPNDLLDQRDQLVNTIAERIDIQRYEIVQGELGLGIAGSSISIGIAPIQFETVTGADGTVAIHVQGSDRPTNFVSGKIAALTELHNDFVEHFTNKIDEFASALIRQVDQAHAVGVGLNGPYSIMHGTRSVADVTASLNSSGLPFPVEAGELYLTVTSSDNARRISAINIDPENDSLEDIAAKISSVDNVQAIVDQQTGKLSIIAARGFRFDFTGNLETTPDLTNVSGSSIPWIGGSYDGDSNGKFTIRAVGSGQIGSATNLIAQVINAGGQVIKEVNLGVGYEPGSEIDLGDGVTIGFQAGNLVDGDTFDVTTIANSDTSGILSALGLNSFFEGTNASNIQVAERIVDNSDEIATSRSGDIGDTRNLASLIGLRNAHVLADNRLTFDDFLAETNSEIGFHVQSSKIVRANVAELNYQYQAERDSASGVDVNEELLYMTQYQKSYEAAVQVVRTMDAMLSELFQIIR